MQLIDRYQHTIKNKNSGCVERETVVWETITDELNAGNGTVRKAANIKAKYEKTYKQFVEETRNFHRTGGGILRVVNCTPTDEAIKV